jgi:alpha-ketoglutarate-dependent taurine dioxygenase
VKLKPSNNYRTSKETADEINKLNPEKVLDVIRFHPLQGQYAEFDNLDPYNNCADYEVDILDYKVKPASHDVIIALRTVLTLIAKMELKDQFSHS